ncbi:MAG TPA: hypothetical protein VEC37_15140 [Bacillota bacterium]|nr:hypothetical protein [Bacillota bacterium]
MKQAATEERRRKTGVDSGQKQNIQNDIPDYASSHNNIQEYFTDLQSTIGNQALIRLIKSGYFADYGFPAEVQTVEETGPIIHAKSRQSLNAEQVNENDENILQLETKEKPGEKATRDVVRATAGTIEVEAILRDIYRRTDEAIVREAEYMLSKGVLQNEVAKWVVETRNATKARIRKWDLDVLRLLAENSNKKIYGDKLGPSYEDLRKGTRNKILGAKPPKTDLKIIEGAKVTRVSVNQWVGILRIAGRILIAIDIGFSGYQVAVARPIDRPRVLIKETSRFMGALAVGWTGAKIGGAIGGGIGAWFGGAGAIPGAVIGGIIGGVGGAIGGAKLGAAAGDLLIYKLYPPKETQFEGAFR